MNIKILKKILCSLSFLSLFFLVGCSLHEKNHEKIHVGIDWSWAPYDFKNYQIQLKGFIQDLFLEITKKESFELEEIDANWDALFEGLIPIKDVPHYDCVISLKQPYNFNEAKYEFSKLFLPTGPVIIYPQILKKVSLKKAQRIGVVKNHSAVRILETYPNLLILSYSGPSEIFRDLERKNVDLAVMDRLVAMPYIHERFEQKYALSAPLDEQGLRFVALNAIKGKETIRRLNQALKILEKDQILEKLQKKWQL